LISEGAIISGHDPVAIENMKAILSHESITYVNDLQSAINNVDAIVLVTSWPEYHNLRMLIKSKEIPIIDGRRFLDKKQFDKYSGIGLSNTLRVNRGIK
jgi:UDPglucose 6-dehydrogenase/GDP-mannose 6-dehydrogenase